MRHDQFGLPLTIDAPEAARAWDAAVRAFLAHSAATPEHLGAALAAEPGFAIGHAAKGLLTLMLGRRELGAVARAAHADAVAAARRDPPTEREAAYVAALGAWLAGRPSGAVACMDAVLEHRPGDALAMKVGHAIRFILGDDRGMREAMERVMPAYGEGHPARGYALGCHAFALEETGDYEAAERAGRMGLDLAPDDAWGLHAVAHKYDMTGDARGGLAWMAGREAAWAHCNNFRHHVWWHVALMRLDAGEVDEVFRLYDEAVRAERTDDWRDISNAASLLMRLELDGHAVGDRWEELARLAQARTEDGCMVFADLHYMMALASGGRRGAAASMLARMARDAARPGEVRARTASPGLAAAEGLAAFGEGDHTRAFAALGRARGSMQLAGGSHAQRDVFERMTVDAGLRAGLLDEAEALLVDRTRRRGGFEDGYAAARHAVIAEARRQAARPSAEDGARRPAVA